ncbi:DoxX family membrane protein [Streptomyces sp. PD-S100-1]|uniref:DoxX family membrane protein n=1 Tax=Streptomyces sp. PD-S100-1 TaxID=3394351 RepID=UPI0039BC30FA
MSVDTRTPRTPTGDRSSGYDDAPALSMVKVPSDPAQVIVSHASFRVQLGAASWRARSPRPAPSQGAADTAARVPAAGLAGTAAPRRPLVWSGRSAPDDTGAHRLLQAVRSGSVGHTEESAADAGATQVIPRIDAGPGRGAGGGSYDTLDQTVGMPVVGGPHGPDSGETRLLPHMRTAESGYDSGGYGGHTGTGYATPGGAPPHTRPGHPDGYAYDGRAYGGQTYDDAYDDEPYGPDETVADGRRRGRRHSDDPARHAYYPGRRMNLGVVLLPLRIFLGFVTIYAGMGKLCDPLYFDGGKRGSMVKWLNSLHPWEAAEPLRQFALQHPVGSGLVIAFLQVIVGVLTILGCWQRVAAVFGALLSAALIVTVSWRTLPVYDAPDIIYLAAWSPLIIAGAPVYSVDGRLAASAWRRLGPRAHIWDLRRYVLRRGALLTVVVTGLTLLTGSLLGDAVRDADQVVAPRPGEAPRNALPGSPLPRHSDGKRQDKSPTAPAAPSRRGTTTGPSGGPATTPGTARESGGATTGAPSQTQGTTGRTTPRQSAPVRQAPSTSAGPTSGGGASGGSGSGGDSGSAGGTSSGRPGLVGGLLG